MTESIESYLLSLRRKLIPSLVHSLIRDALLLCSLATVDRPERDTRCSGIGSPQVLALLGINFRKHSQST